MRLSIKKVLGGFVATSLIVASYDGAFLERAVAGEAPAGIVFDDSRAFIIGVDQETGGKDFRFTYVYRDGTASTADRRTDEDVDVARPKDIVDLAVLSCVAAGGGGTCLGSLRHIVRTGKTADADALDAILFNAGGRKLLFDAAATVGGAILRDGPDKRGGFLPPRQRSAYTVLAAKRGALEEFDNLSRALHAECEPGQIDTLAGRQDFADAVDRYLDGRARDHAAAQAHVFFNRLCGIVEALPVSCSPEEKVELRRAAARSVIVARKIFASYKIDEHSVKIDDDVSDVDVLDGLCSGRLREVVLDRGVLRTTGFYNYLGTIGMTVPPDEGVETENAETRGDGEDEVSGEDLVDAVAGYKVPSVDNDGKQVPAVVPISKGGVIEFVPVASTPVADAIRDYARGNLSDFPEDLATIGHQDLGEILIGNYGFMLDLWTDLAAKNKQLKSLQTRMNALGDGNAAAGLSNAAIARQLSDSNAEVERLKGELESAKRQMPNAGARADDIDITQLREQLVAANRGVSELDGQLAQRDTVIIQLRADLASEKNAKDSKQTELVSKVQEVRDLETRLAEARDSLDDFRRTLEAAEEENRVSKSKELTLTDEVERLVRYCNDLQSGTIPDDRISIMDEGALIDLRDKTQAALKALQMKKGDETLKTTLKAPRRVAGGTDRGAAKQTMTPEQRVTTPPEHQQPPETGRAGAPGTQRPEVGPLKAPRRVAKR